MLPPEISPTTKSAAERVIFERIRDELPDDWYGLHSLGLASHPRKPWAEIDFVLVGPDGVFCLEVKGGRISRHGGLWRFTDRFGNTDAKAEGPFEQAGSASSALYRYLRDKGEWLREVIVGYGVAMPDITFAIEGPDVEPDVVYDEDYADRSMSEYLRSLTSFWKSRLGKPDPLAMTARQIDRVVDYLRADFDLSPSLRARLRHTRNELIRLTDEQRLVLAGLENDRCIITGGAGTGKTLLAFERAVSAARAGERVLFTCYSRRLGEELAAAGKAVDELTVVNLHAFMKAAVAAAGRMSNLPEADADDLFEVFYPAEALESLLDLEEVGAWDLVVVDEAQDLLLDAYLDVLDVALSGGLASGKWIMFMDPNQDLFRGVNASGMRRLNEARPARYRLTINCRNTTEIATETCIMSGANTLSVLRAEGPRVQHLWYRDEADQQRRVARYVNRLLSGGLRPEDIVVVGRRRLTSSGLSRGLEGVPYRLSEEGGTNAIEYATISGFKGLEADVVVLVDVDDLSRERAEDLYVATSRARLLLAVALAESARPAYESRATEYGARFVALG